MLNNKKGQQFPTIKVILILVVSTIILISWVLVLLKVDSIIIDEREINTQIVLNTITNSNCFKDSKGIYNFEKFESENINQCLNGLDKNTYVKIILREKKIIALNKEKEFDSKVILCGKSSTILCTEMIYPIILDATNDVEPLIIQIITSN